MKKIYTYILMIACTLIFASCQKEFDGIFTAEIEAPECNDSKVYINENNYACWANGDPIVFAVVAKSNGLIEYPESSVEINNDLATIDAGSDIALESTSKIDAYYKHDKIAENGIFVFYPIISANQNQDNVFAPMHATTTNSNLKFTNSASILKFNITNSNTSDITIKSIKLTSGEDIAGTMKNDGNFIGGSKEIVLKSESTNSSSSTNIKAGTSKAFYMCIPPLVRTYKVTLEYEKNGQSISVYKEGLKVNAEVNHIYILNVTPSAE